MEKGIFLEKRGTKGEMGGRKIRRLRKLLRKRTGVCWD